MSIWRHWEIIPLFELLASELGYLLAVGPLRRRFAGTTPVPRGKQIAFTLGVASLLVAVASPLDALADDLLSMHMVQHTLLIVIAPPLLLLGTPAWLARTLLAWPAAHRIGRIMTRPLPAFLIFNGVLLGWHVPALYELALRVEPVHILEHVLFLATALLSWWPVLSPLPELPRLSHPSRLIYLSGQGMLIGFVGGALTLINILIYPSYARMLPPWNIDPLADQHIAGVVMWLPCGLVFFIIFIAIWLEWMTADGVDVLYTDGRSSAHAHAANPALETSLDVVSRKEMEDARRIER